MWYVYQLDSTNGLIYFGMTSNPKQRFIQHKCGISRCMSKLLFADDACVEMRILDEYVSRSVCQEREKYYIRKYVCVNKKGKGLDMESNKAYLKKWYQENKERCKERKNKWNHENKEKKNAHNREKITCDNCGTVVRRDSMSKHKKSKKCLNFCGANS